MSYGIKLHISGTIAGNARRGLESQSGTKISTPDNYQSLPQSTRRISKKKS
jgi:hypothetical protein